jgi:hypothetical protein
VTIRLALGISHVLLEKSEKTITTTMVRRLDQEKVRSRLRSRTGRYFNRTLVTLHAESARWSTTNGRRDRTAITSIQLCQFEIESSTVAINVRRLVILSHGMSCVYTFSTPVPAHAHRRRARDKLSYGATGPYARARASGLLALHTSWTGDQISRW